jgi:hypothetical protein
MVLDKEARDGQYDMIILGAFSTQVMEMLFNKKQS